MALRTAPSLVAAWEISIGIAFGLIYLRRCAFRTVNPQLNNGKLCVYPVAGVSMQFTAFFWI